MTKFDNILKGKDITLPTKVHIVKAMVFPVVMYRCESWTIKKAECRRLDAFELWSWSLAIIFLVVMYGCESWTIKKAEYQRIDAFELWCWRRLLRVPWTAKRSNQSILVGPF